MSSFDPTWMESTISFVENRLERDLLNQEGCIEQKSNMFSYVFTNLKIEHLKRQVMLAVFMSTTGILLWELIQRDPIRLSFNSRYAAIANLGKFNQQFTFHCT